MTQAKAVAVKSSGFSENPKTHSTSTSKDEVSKKLDGLVGKLKECASLLKRGIAAKRDAVSSMEKYLDALPRGQKTEALKKLCARAEIHIDTYYQWKNDIGDEIVLDEVRPLVEKDGRVLDKPLSREILKAHRDDPKATSPEALLKAYKVVDAPKTRVTQPPIQPFTEALDEYLRKSDYDVDGLFQALANAAIPRDKLRAALKVALEAIQ